MEPCEQREPLPRFAMPRVDVRVVLFSVSDGRLWVAMNQTQGSPRLPSSQPRPEESLDAAAARVLSEHLNVEERYIEQLYSISQGAWEDWTVAVTYLGLASANADGPPPTSGQWFDVARLPALAPDDRMIIDYALMRLRAKLGYTTIAFHFLPPCFSLSELQQVYESVLDRTLDKRNFRRRIHAEGFLEATGATRRDGSHRPARLYRFRAAHDVETYLTPAWATDGERRGAET
jgi:8-oxo-dGTP diphosphatase